MINHFGRKEAKWESTLYDLTPIEEVDGLVFKREDKYAPVGYGAINGSKLRQLIWLVHGYVSNGGTSGVLSGASVHSPQVSMGTAVANHYGLPSTHVLGATNPDSSIKHSNVAMAAVLGATFEYSKVAYNGALQGMVKNLLREPRYRDYFHLEYGVTLGHKIHPARYIEAFHRVGAEQVRNIPECESLIIPSGSCNSLTSILYGIALYRPKIKRLIMVEIGPSRRDWVRERLIAIKVANRSVNGISRILNGSEYPVEYHDLHGTGYSTYQDVLPYSHGGIDFHERYEGKVMTYLKQRRPDLLNQNNVIWIIAGDSYMPNMMKAIERHKALEAE
mgnify:CR=1 FL=1|tara:strand:- start:1684 stop:2682 length:999 start_codon:yes stop_codon:yes gene_type:complete